MEAKLLKSEVANYVPADWSGTNESGISPVGDRVLILPDKAATFTLGGIELPDDLVHRHTLAAEAGVIVALGEGAFKWNSDKVTPFAGRAPKPGDRVCIERYSGQLARGDDNNLYRLMDSACIAAILEKETK